MAKRPHNPGVTPLGDRVLIKPALAETTTASGIIIPDTVSKEKPEQGIVVAVGEGRMTDAGEIIEVAVKPGDTVLFSKYSPEEITINGEDYLIVREEAILAVFES